jgi:tetratricopeptide (TPR) repeat protein
MRTLFLLCVLFVPSLVSAAPAPKAGPPSPEAARSRAMELLQPVAREVEHAQADVQRGLASGSSTRSLAALRLAQHTYDAALHSLDRIARQHAGDAVLIDSLGALRHEARDGAVETAIDAGQVYLSRADFQKAMMEANKAVSIDPDDVQAEQFRWTAATLPSQSVVGVFPLRLRTSGVRAPITGAQAVPRTLGMR